MTTLTPSDLDLSLQGQSPITERTAARRWLRALEVLVLLCLAYVPLLLGRRGVATPDTKTYLYLNPAKFLSQVASMWDPTVAMGTVTHQYIGYLLPMGPFFLVLHLLSVPLWVAQRLWLGSIMFAAGLGVLYLCRTLRLTGPGRLVAALAFMLSPYILQYAGRISVLLLPWAGLPWMVAFAVLALRKKGWRYPALFAIVVALVSSINATSIIYVGLAPILWILYATIVEREATWATAAWTALKIGLLSAFVSLWWVVGLMIEAGYGVDVLKYTETVVATSGGSSASEIIRGLGYWYFYGSDRLGPWTRSVQLYTQAIPVMAVSYGIPILALLATAVLRWRSRAYFALLVVVGMVLSVGAHPFASPTPFGGVLKAFMTQTTAGLAMRSTDRATPLVVLGMAMLLGAGISAIWRRIPRLGLVLGGIVMVLVVLNNPALFNGDTIANDFAQPEHLPPAQMAAIHYLNGINPTLRVLGIPGNDFASYRWGNTVDAPQPAFLTRPYVTHEQQVMGSMATADLLYAFDDPIQENTAVPAAIAPMARLMSAANLLVNYDTQYEHFGQPHPSTIHALLNPTPAGLTNPKSFGRPVVNVASFPTLSEEDLVAAHPFAPLPPAVVYDVPGARPVTRAESDLGAMIISGNAGGLQAMAGIGLLNTNSALYYSGSLATNPTRVHGLMAKGAQLVVTDSNRKQGFRWDTIAASAGATETASQNPQKTDPTDNPINLFPDAPRTAQTRASYLGAVSVTASSYGIPFSYLPEDRAFSAVDGNLDTAWRTGIFMDPVGEWWQIAFATPTTTDHVTLVQSQNGDLARWLTQVRLTFDGRSSIVVNLTPASRAAQGQIVTFPTRSFHVLRITILHSSNDHAPPAQATAVGLAEVQIPGRQVAEVLAMPTDLTNTAGAASIANRLTYVMTRWQASPFPTRFDPETTIARSFEVPSRRAFSIAGNASLSTLIPDDQVDRLLGSSSGLHGVPVAYSSGRILGGLNRRASATIDGDLTSYWEPGFGAEAQVGSWLRYQVPHPLTFSSMDLQVVTDGRHSVPTQVTVSTDSGSRTLALPPLLAKSSPGATTSVPLTFAPLTGRQITVTFTKVALRNTVNYNSPIPIAEPIGIAEVGIPGLSAPPAPAALPGTCQDNLLSIDGNPVWVSINGSTSTAVSNQSVAVTACGPSASGIVLGPGLHVLEAAAGHGPSTGWNLNTISLDSLAGGAAAPLPVAGAAVPVQPGPAPIASVSNEHATSQRVTVRQAGGSFELVLGQSNNAGWQAIALPSAAGHGGVAVDLGPPQLVDGFANGWHVTERDLATLGLSKSQLASSNASFVVALTWTPQSSVWLAIGVSIAALLSCLVLALWPWIRRRRRRAGLEDVESTPHRPPVGVEAASVDAPLTRAEIMAHRRSASVSAGNRTLAAQSAQGADNEGRVELLLPFEADGSRPTWWVTLLATVVAGAIGAVIAAPWIGAMVAIVVLLGCVVDRTRGLASLGSVGFLVAAAVNVLTQQSTKDYMFGEWPTHFNGAGTLTWVAVCLLGADALISVLRTRSTGRASEHPPSTP
jgi:hypothetical protein